MIEHSKICSKCKYRDVDEHDPPCKECIYAFFDDWKNHKRKFGKHFEKGNKDEQKQNT